MRPSVISDVWPDHDRHGIPEGRWLRGEPGPGESGTWLCLIGEFAAGRGLRRWPLAEVGSRKTRTLLALLAVANHRLVTVDRIVDALWGDTWPKRPVQGIATLVSRVRAKFGPATISGGRSGGYRLGPSVTVDLFETARIVADAESRLAGAGSRRALSTAERALAVLDRGDVLPDQLEARWADNARALHADLVRRARHAVAHAGLYTGELTAARSAAAAAIATDPIDETAYRALIRIHAANGETGWALTAYEQLRTTLAAELGIDPAPATHQLYLEILRGA